MTDMGFYHEADREIARLSKLIETYRAGIRLIDHVPALPDGVTLRLQAVVEDITVHVKCPDFDRFRQVRRAFGRELRCTSVSTVQQTHGADNCHYYDWTIRGTDLVVPVIVAIQPRMGGSTTCENVVVGQRTVPVYEVRCR